MIRARRTGTNRVRRMPWGEESGIVTTLGAVSSAIASAMMKAGSVLRIRWAQARAGSSPAPGTKVFKRLRPPPHLMRVAAILVAALTGASEAGA